MIQSERNIYEIAIVLLFVATACSSNKDLASQGAGTAAVSPNATQGGVASPLSVGPAVGSTYSAANAAASGLPPTNANVTIVATAPTKNAGLTQADLVALSPNGVLGGGFHNSYQVVTLTETGSNATRSVAAHLWLDQDGTDVVGTQYTRAATVSVTTAGAPCSTLWYPAIVRYSLSAPLVGNDGPTSVAQGTYTLIVLGVGSGRGVFNATTNATLSVGADEANCSQTSVGFLPDVHTNSVISGAASVTTTTLGSPIQPNGVRATALTWQTVANGQLFGSAGPVITDIQQGVAPNDAFFAALGSMANNNAAFINSLFTYAGKTAAGVDVYTVNFFDVTTGTRHPVNVDMQLLHPVKGSIYDPYGQDANAPTVPILWPYIAQKAAAVYFGGYEAIPQDALKCITLLTGFAGTTLPTSSAASGTEFITRLKLSLSSGIATVLTPNTSAPSTDSVNACATVGSTQYCNLVNGMVSVLSVDDQNGTVTVRAPEKSSGEASGALAAETSIIPLGVLPQLFTNLVSDLGNDASDHAPGL